MKTTTLTPDNLEQEHICCALSNNNDPQVGSKKAWLADRFDEGLVFLKGDVRGKCFIEYLPAEYAWVPIEAPGYIHINCFWVSGQHKGQGWSNVLLEECIADAQSKGKRGLTILSSKNKKQAFLADPKHLAYKGFKIVDTASPFFALYYLPFDDGAACMSSGERAGSGVTQENDVLPRFRDCVSDTIDQAEGYVLYYTHQCPFTIKYVPLIERVAKDQGVPFEAVLLDTREKAQNAPCPFTTYALYYQGGFVTNEILSEKKFSGMLSQIECERR